MDVQSYTHIASTFFNDGIINKGRVIVLFCLTKIVAQRYPQQRVYIWSIFENVIEGLGYDTYLQRARIEALQPV